MRLQGVCSLKFHESYAMQSNLPCPSAVDDIRWAPTWHTCHAYRGFAAFAAGAAGLAAKTFSAQAGSHGLQLFGRSFGPVGEPLGT